MKQPFKKALLASAVALTCGTVSAGNVAVNKQVHSVEGLAGVTANQTSNAISYVLAAAYRDGDKLTFTFPDGALVSTTFPSQINVPAINNADPDMAIAGLALGLLNSDANSVTYRVTSVTQPSNGSGTDYTDRTTIGATVALGQVGYTTASLASGDVTVTVSSQTNGGDVLDNNGTRTATIAESKSQFGSAAVGSGFDATINVSAMRKAFLGETSDSMTWTITNPATTGWLNLATVNASNGTVVTVSGVAGKFSGLTGDNFSAGGTDTVDEAAATVTVSYGGMTTNDTITFTPSTADNAPVLEAQAFASNFEYNYTSAGAQAGTKVVGTAVPSGSWDLNGATVNVPYMPYGPNASQVLYVTNAGTQNGDISAIVFDDTGTTYDLGVIATANANTVTKLAPALNQALLAAGFTGSKTSITVTVNAPEDDITVHASFNIGGADRAFVITDQYKGIE